MAPSSQGLEPPGIPVRFTLRTTNGFENLSPELRDDLRGEEASLQDDIEKLPVFPVAVIGVSYTF